MPCGLAQLGEFLPIGDTIAPLDNIAQYLEPMRQAGAQVSVLQVRAIVNAEGDREPLNGARVAIAQAYGAAAQYFSMWIVADRLNAFDRA